MSTPSGPAAAGYDSEYFAGHVRHRHRYERIAETLHRVLKPLSVADLGCGNAYILEFLHLNHAVDVLGVEGSVEVTPFLHRALKDRVLIGDVSQPLLLPKTYELVVCTEVGEHLDGSAADNLVQSLVRAARFWVYFTAAQPGQPGVGHVNCQPKSYWQEKFARHGFRRDPAVEARIKAGIWTVRSSLPWMYDNLMVLGTDEARKRCAGVSRRPPDLALRGVVGTADLAWALARGGWRMVPAGLRQGLKQKLLGRKL